MKKRLVVLMMLCGCLVLGAVGAQAETAKSTVNKISPEGIGEEIGIITFMDSPEGLVMEVDVMSLPVGARGMHIHEVGDCSPGMTPDGKAVAGLAAKGHFDPDKSAAHKGPEAAGHKGDLPALQVDADGKAKVKLVAKNLKVNDVRNRAIMIHAGGDNYADQPAPLGGGGARVACGVIK